MSVETKRWDKKSFGFMARVAWIRGVFVLSIAFYLGLNACVETAECDETVGCGDGQVCYDLKCEALCQSEDECGVMRSCSPCLENVGAGVSDHCFSVERSACVLTESEQ